MKSYVLSAVVPNRQNGGFEEVSIDTGAARGSTFGREPYLVYCNSLGRDPDIDPSRAAIRLFDIGSSRLQGMGKVTIPVDGMWCGFQVRVVDNNVPVFKSIDDLDRLGLLYNNPNVQRIYLESSLATPVTRLCGHPYLQWQEQIQTIRMQSFADYNAIFDTRTSTYFTVC